MEAPISLLLSEPVALFLAEAGSLAGGVMSTLLTYKIVSDQNGKVKKAARTACNFWNRLVEPRRSIVIRLGLFSEESDTVAQAYEPHVGPKGVVYGRVDFNRKFLKTFTPTRTAGTIVHELGHTLGFGWNRWMRLFDEDSGEFKPRAVRELPALGKMLVETNGGDGTALSHWDEEMFGKELMTGYEDPAEHVLPVTIDVMTLLGHRVKTRLGRKTTLAKLLRASAAVTFTRKAQAKKLDLDHFTETLLWETVPHKVGRRHRTRQQAT
jgi:hypothetical protein